MLNLHFTPFANLSIWIAVTAALGWISRHSLLKPKTHGFYRFLSWECILCLILVNLPMWELDPFSPRQLVSWMLLAASPILAIHGLRVLKQFGHADGKRFENELFRFERTTRLVTNGAFRYIRHPMYAALLLLAWGAFLKNVSLTSIALVAGASIAVLLTAICDETECVRYFGEQYTEYMKLTRRFIPFVV
jgi:protein-S-isoprenylcysteine O-methyltransferase Ste14